MFTKKVSELYDLFTNFIFILNQNSTHEPEYDD